MALLQAVTGMNDVLPAEAGRWRSLEARFFETAARYGFREVRTPLCEYTELFSRGVGEGTDIVEKEMYVFDDRGGRALALRPEGTASAVRCALEHAALEREPVVRWAYAGAMFRAEKPARGRFRQFHQVGAEVYGDASPAADAEVLDLLVAFLRSLGLGAFELRVNSLGQRGSRQRYRDALVAHFSAVAQELSPESRERLGRNPLRILDSKDPRDQTPKLTAPSVLDHLDDEDRAHFARVRAYLDALGTPYRVDPTLVRGLDYYTRTVFEVVDTSGSLGAQDALGGGGRYDNLFTELGGDGVSVPAVGFALGVERLLLAQPVKDPPAPFRVAVVAAARETDQAVLASALSLARELREAGLETHLDTRFVSMKSQLRRADDLGARAVLIVGRSELEAGTVAVKDMAAHAQTVVPRGAVAAHLRALSGSQE
ncbi:MAG: histidine--tRNA ligase [Deltaproteobacteria bacterium]|nr:histidine--tRNA ligase [Deltaproteobacteria bacterium]